MTNQHAHAITRRTFGKLASFALLGSGAARLARAQGSLASGVMTFVGTRAFDNYRTGCNPHETVLTQASMRQRGVRVLFTLPMEGDARGTEGQPLFVPSVAMPDGTRRDVVLVASMNNTVWAFDANNSDDLWMTKLGVAVKGNAAIDLHQINDHWGVLSTGVIDRDTNLFYCVAITSKDGSQNPQGGHHAVYTLDIATGAQAKPPVFLDGTSYKPDAPNARAQNWDDAMRKQRSSLVMTDVGGRKTIFFGSGTVLEVNDGAEGWIFALDVATHRISATWAATQGYGAGIWMAGQGIAADDAGFLYCMTGNGSFDPVHGDFGECFLKLAYTPPANATALGKISPVGWWSPYTDAGRMGEGVTQTQPRMRLMNKLSGVSAPTSSGHMPPTMVTGAHMPEAAKATNMVEVPHGGPTRPHFASTQANNQAYGDEDLGSAGVTLLPGARIMIGGGKDGILYEVSLDQPGNTLPADFAHARANYAKLKQPPFWGSYFPGFNVDAGPQDPTTLNFLFDGKTRHLHSTPVQFLSPKWGRMLFVWGENSNLRAFAVNEQTGALTFLAQGAEIASAQVNNQPGGMPGGFMSISTNGQAPGTALLWATIPYGDGNAEVTNGRLLCYDPENFVTYPDGSKGLQVLWDSQAQGVAFVFNKFDPPVVNGGKVWVPTYDDSVLVLG